MKLIMKNYEIKAFGDFLFKLSLKGKDSRMRSRFLSSLEDQNTLISKERDLLLTDFGKKDDEGNVITEIGDNGATYAVLADSTAYNIEIAKLMSEDFIIDVTSTNQDMFKTLQSIILDCDLEFSGVEAERYSRFCEIVEQFNFDL